MNETKAGIALNSAPDVVTQDSGAPSLPPWLFQHREIVQNFSNSLKLRKEKIINIINHAHFIDRHLYACFGHPTYDEGILLTVSPEPCIGSSVTCNWQDQSIASLKIGDYHFQYLIIPNNGSIVVSPATVLSMNEQSLTLTLPEQSYSLDQRKTKRHGCSEIPAEIVQSGILAKGILMDFNPEGFRILITSDHSMPRQWYNPEIPAIIHLRVGNHLLFAGPCRHIRERNHSRGTELVFAPNERQIIRFQKKIIRNPRITLIPQPLASFRHPFFRKMIQREIVDISAAGFSVIEKCQDSVLMPGLIIPELSIMYAGAMNLKCCCQVIYRRCEGNQAMCGIAILDMDVPTYSQLTQLISQTSDPHAFISNNVDTENLWEFFFDAGFIYPEKYHHIQMHRAEFKKTYEKLYHGKQDIAIHFTYETDGRIFGHIAMIRAYECAWMIHHFAARPMEGHVTGFQVLKQIIHCINGLYRLPSAQMNYVMTYFRPNNRIIDRVFGGFARELNNPQGSSLDRFSYLTFHRHGSSQNLPPGWSIDDCSSMDLWKLDLYYRNVSGGLLLDAINWGKKKVGADSVGDTYARHGFIRRWNTFCLKKNGNIAAVLIVNQSNLLINLSDLINGVKVIVMDSSELTWNIIQATVFNLTQNFQTNNIPLLIYPSTFTAQRGISTEKDYDLWILNTAHFGDRYLEYMEKSFRIRLNKDHGKQASV